MPTYADKHTTADLSIPPWRGEGDFKQRDFGQCVIKNSSLDQYGSRFKQNYWLYFIPVPRT